MPLHLTQTGEGVVFSVKVQPGAGHNALAGEWQGAVKLKIAKKPENGEATRACLEFVAECLQVPKRAVTLLRGATSHLKVLRVAGVTPAEVEARLKCP